MRSLFVILAVAAALSLTACESQDANVPSTTDLNLATPMPTRSVAQADLATPTNWPTPTLILPTRRAPEPTKTPKLPAAAPTRSDGIPIPDDATPTKNIPDDVRTFIQGQLKGMQRVGQPEGYVSPHPQDEVLTSYQQDLASDGWDSVLVNTGLDNNAKLLVAQNTQLRVVVAFVSQGAERTLTYIVTTRK